MLRNRLFLVALSVSALFHLSMVTLFSIVFEFPVTRIDYYSFRILSEESAFSGDPAAHPGERMAGLPTLQNPLRDTGLEGLGLEPTPSDWAAGLPAIELPRLEFAEMQMLEVREEGLSIRSRLVDFLDAPLSDPWSRLSRGLERLGDALSSLGWFDDADKETLARPAPKLVARPAEGFEAYVEWMSEPLNRELLFSPPIEALFRLHPEDLREPITLVFRVNPRGEVIEVLTPLPDEAGVVVSAARALTSYRFEPLDTPEARDQHGTLLITSARAREGALP